MKRNWVYPLVAVVLLGVLGAGALWGYRQYKRKRDQMWEACGNLVLVRSLGDEEMKKFLARENELLHSERVMLPVVRQLGLVADFHVTSEADAVARLRSRSEVRKGNPAMVLVVFRDPNRELASKVNKELGAAFIQAHPKPDGGGGDGATGY